MLACGSDETDFGDSDSVIDTWIANAVLLMFCVVARRFPGTSWFGPVRNDKSPRCGRQAEAHRCATRGWRAA